jgi:DNA polymerase-4
VTAAKLRKRGIRTVGEVAGLDESVLVTMLGRASGRHLHALAHNYDPRPVQTGRRRRSIGSQRALGRRPRPPEEIAASLIAIVDRVTRRLRGANRVCRTVTIRLRFGDFSRATRSKTLPEPTANTELLRAARPVIDARGLTLIGLSLSNLADEGAYQLVLPFGRGRDLDTALDQIHEKYGSRAITRGVLVGRDPGISVPMLPD